MRPKPIRLALMPTGEPFNAALRRRPRWKNASATMPGRAIRPGLTATAGRLRRVRQTTRMLGGGLSTRDGRLPSVVIRLSTWKSRTPHELGAEVFGRGRSSLLGPGGSAPSRPRCLAPRRSRWMPTVYLRVGLPKVLRLPLARSREICGGSRPASITFRADNITRGWIWRIARPVAGSAAKPKRRLPAAVVRNSDGATVGR